MKETLIIAVVTIIVIYIAVDIYFYKRKDYDIWHEFLKKQGEQLVKDECDRETKQNKEGE